MGNILVMSGRVRPWKSVELTGVLSRTYDSDDVLTVADGLNVKLTEAEAAGIMREMIYDKSMRNALDDAAVLVMERAVKRHAQRALIGA